MTHAPRPEAPEFKRGFAVGVAVACGIIQSTHDNPAAVSEALMATGFDTRAKLKRAGADDYDLKLLKAVFAECKIRSRK